MLKTEVSQLAASTEELGHLFNTPPAMLNENRGDSYPTNTLISALDYIAHTGRDKLLYRMEESRDKSYLWGLRTELGKLARDFALLDNPDIIYEFPSCAEAEPRFLQCVDAMEKAIPIPKDKIAANPATIYIDEDNAPIALRKNWGDPTTLILRPSRHIPYVPEGTIVAASYGGIVPFLGAQMTNEQIIPIDDNPQVQIGLVEKSLALNVARPSAFTLSPDLLLDIEYDPTENIEKNARKLRTFAQDVALTSLADIVKRVDQIAASVGV